MTRKKGLIISSLSVLLGFFLNYAAWDQSGTLWSTAALILGEVMTFGGIIAFAVFAAKKTY